MNAPTSEQIKKWDWDAHESDSPTNEVLATLAYQAGYNAALEAAAKVCESESHLGLEDERAYNGILMAKAIRSLKQ